MHMRGVRAVRSGRWPVPVFCALVSTPPVRFVRRFVRFVMFRRHRVRWLMVLRMERLMMLSLMVRHMMCGRRLVLPGPGMLGRGSWSLVGQFRRRRSAGGVWDVRCAVHTTHVWSSPDGWHAAYVWRSGHDRNITGRGLAKPGGQGSDSIGSDGFKFVACAVQVMPRVQVEGFLCGQCFLHRLVSSLRLGRR